MQNILLDRKHFFFASKHFMLKTRFADRLISTGKQFGFYLCALGCKSFSTTICLNLSSLKPIPEETLIIST